MRLSNKVEGRRSIEEEIWFGNRVIKMVVEVGVVWIWEVEIVRRVRKCFWVCEGER